MGVYIYIRAHFFRSIRWVAAVLLVLISLLFSHWYDSHIIQKSEEIEAVYDSFEVRIELSNLSGTSTQHLSMLPYDVLPFFEEEFVHAGKTVSGFETYIKDKHFEVNMCHNIDTGMPVFRESQAKPLLGVFIIGETYDFKEMSGAKIRYFDPFDDSLFVYDGGGRRREPACVIPSEMEEQIKYDEEGRGYIDLLVATTPAASRFKQMHFRVAGVHTAENGTVYCPFSLASAIAGDLSEKNDSESDSSYLGQYLSGSPEYTIVKVDAASAVVVDNRKIPELRNLADFFYRRPQFSSSSESQDARFMGNTSVAYSIHDKELNDTVNLLKKNLDTLVTLRPLFAILESLIVFVAIFFYFQTRRRENAVARTLGISRRKLLAISVGESLIISLMAVGMYFPIVGEVSSFGLLAYVPIGAAVSSFVNTGKKAFQSIRTME